jgi:hypothetical protein
MDPAERASRCPTGRRQLNSDARRYLFTQPVGSEIAVRVGRHSRLAEAVTGSAVA